jgi:hypothetical protein
MNLFLNSKKKSCPSCRKTLGTKRQLRTDVNVLELSEKFNICQREHENKT